MSDYIRGSTRPHKAAEDEGISLAGFGVPKESLDAWMHLQSFFARGEVTPCHSRPEWTSNRKADKELAIRLCGDCPAKAACNEFAESIGETTGIWAGIDRDKK
ncbi:Transcription factor WhiB [Brevibacterium sp. 239c]|uniref:WhiB family transcriptional regulator n=1 Tax=Brevibacterium sp. 239c TaxID=1965356 RepID=UPI000C3811D8|nr:Transcription factor WhiB [Brevibacterium sp. 239c]